MSAAFRYKAFLSYSHKDHKEAAWLHRALEKYQFPKHFRASADDANGAGQSSENIRLGRIFRDREELPAADDLTAEVKKALHSSEFMIVLCSPSAAASRWVNKEIIEFKKLRGEAAVLPIILDGEPGASETGDAALECFPPGVRFRLGADGTLSRKRAEPIAADIRKSGDGRQRALMKLIAGLLGVGLDRLIEREMQRKQRRVIAVTAASIAGTLLMGALTYQAVSARREAEVNRAQAEDLVEFMLTDLRQKLEPVGRLDVLDAVGAKAVSYYDAQELEKMPDASLGRRARAFHLLGEIEQARGEMDQAKAMFDKAMAATNGLLVRSPQNAGRIFDHSQSVFWVGYQDLKRGNYKEAEDAFLQYKVLAEKLVSLDPKNDDWQLELGYAHGNIGALQLENLREPEAALANFRASGVLLERLSAKNPADTGLKRSIADNKAWIADAIRRVGDADEVLHTRELQRGILAELLAVDPQDKQALRQLIHVDRAVARVMLLQGKMQSALDHYFAAARRADALVKSDPENEYWAYQRAEVSFDLAESLMKIGDFDAARLRFDEGKFLSEPLLNSDKVSIEKQILLGFGSDLLNLQLESEAQSSTISMAELEALLQRMLAGQAGLVEHDLGKMIFASIYVLKAKVLIAAGDDTAARELLHALWSGRTSIGALDLTQNQDPKWMRLVAEVAPLIGEQDVATAMRQALEQRGYSTDF